MQRQVKILAVKHRIWAKSWLLRAMWTHQMLLHCWYRTASCPAWRSIKGYYTVLLWPRCPSGPLLQSLVKILARRHRIWAKSWLLTRGGSWMRLLFETRWDLAVISLPPPCWNEYVCRSLSSKEGYLILLRGNFHESCVFSLEILSKISVQSHLEISHLLRGRILGRSLK
jgi:hypothetical protein